MKRLMLILCTCYLVGCVAYTTVPAGSVSVNKKMSLTTDIAWNKSPHSGRIGPSVQLWTNNGVSLDRVFVISGVKAGKSIFKSYDRGNPMPKFEADMLPPELADLIEISITKLYGEGQVAVNVGEVQPAEISGQQGVRFELDYVSPMGYRVRGQSVAVVKDELLYVIIFDAAELHYYEKYKSTIEQMFESIQLSLGREWVPLG